MEVVSKRKPRLMSQDTGGKRGEPPNNTQLRDNEKVRKFICQNRAYKLVPVADVDKIDIRT